MDPVADWISGARPWVTRSQWDDASLPLPINDNLANQEQRLPSSTASKDALSIKRSIVSDVSVNQTEHFCPEIAKSVI
jgi:hypothetical protein